MQKTNLERKIVLFDLDTSILSEDTLDGCAARFNFSQALTLLRQIHQDPLNILSRAASFMRGRTTDELVTVAGNISINEELVHVVKELKRKSCIVAAISYGYQVMVDAIGERIGADVVLANELKIEHNYATGAFHISNYFNQNPLSTCRHRVCKANALHYLSNRFDIPLSNCVVVSNAKSSHCFLKYAGQALPFKGTNNLLESVLMHF